MKKYTLPVVCDSRKSFYGKAYVIETDNGEKILQSYETEVCMIDASGTFARMWNGYSATTMRHVNNFLALFDIDGGGKKWWDEQPLK